MKQEEYWKTKWENRKSEPRNNFARRSFYLINKRKLKTILDLGCGDGRDTFYFAKKGLKVTAMDFSKSGMDKINDKVKKKNIKNVTPIHCDIRELQLKEKSFDIIYAHLSLLYFDDKTTTQIFNKLYRILKPNGLFFVKCKSTEDWKCGQGRKIGKDYFVQKHNVTRHYFNRKYMLDKLKKFKIVKIRKTSSIYHQTKSSFIEAVASK